MENGKRVIIFSRKEYFIIIVLILLSIFSPLIFSSNIVFNWMGLGKSAAEIGDAIGGISSPFIGILAAFLVYKSFEAQIKANKAQLKLIEDSHKAQMDIISQEMSYNFFTNILDENIKSFNQLRLTEIGNVSLPIQGIDTTSCMINYYLRVEETGQDHSFYADTMISYLEKLLPRLKSLEMIVSQLNESRINNDFKLVKKRFVYNFIYEALNDFAVEYEHRIYEDRMPIKMKELTVELLKSYKNIVKKLD